MSEDKTSLWERVKRNFTYCINGVWEDTRSLWSIRTVKIINLSIRSFLDRDLQMRSASLTYYTVLAIVPALAMLFAIGRGFGFQNLLQTELFRYFPAQRQALESALTYVDNYLAQASQGIFIGIGLIFLIWTLVSLMSNVEDTFNHVWGVTTKRSLQRKFTDYTALFLLLPVLMVCSAGISIFMTDAVQHVFEGNPISPMMHRLLSFTPIVIAWLVFTVAYYLIPNTKVNLRGALFAGILCGTLFYAVQLLFVSGQVYVSKYNAIYGSFAFLPLLLVWLQLSWLITLAGAVLTYAWQNFDKYIHREKVKNMSHTYTNRLAIAVLAIAAERFDNRQRLLTKAELIDSFDIPGPLADVLIDRLLRADLLNAVTQSKGSEIGYQPAYSPDKIMLNDVANQLANLGNTDYAPKAGTRFAKLLERINCLKQHDRLPDMPLTDLLADGQEQP